MFVKKIDIISPPITLHYKGDLSHSSVFAGLLSLAVIVLSGILVVYYTSDFIQKKNPSVAYYIRYINDAGIFYVNSSSMFSFIQIIDTTSNEPEPVDFDSIRIIGIQQTIDTYEQDNDLTQYNHWIYGPCDNSSDTGSISYLIDFQNFSTSACIKKYYRKNLQKYYGTRDKTFVYPDVLHGCSHPDRTFYGIIVEKCRNDSLRFASDNKACKPIENIKTYIQTKSIALQVIDQYADVFNYKKPYTKYFYSLTNGLYEGSYTTNHLNFNPSTLITHDGLLFDRTVETKSYFFDQNEKVTTTMEKEDKGIYVSFYFWMQNRMQYYERTYQRIQDLLSDIGGLCSILLTIANVSNYFINEYVVFSDAQEVLTKIKISKKYDKILLKKNLNSLFQDNDDGNPPIIKTTKTKKTYRHASIFNSLRSNKESNIDQFSSNKMSLSKVNPIFPQNTKPKRSKKQSVIFSSDVSKRLYQNNFINNNSNVKNINIYENKNKTKNENDNCSKIFRNERKRLKSVVINDSRRIKEIENIHNALIRREYTKKKKAGLCDYISYSITCGKTHKKLNYFGDFRKNIISEENIFLNYFNILKLLKFQEEKEIEQENEVKNKELVINDNIDNKMYSNIEKIEVNADNNFNINNDNNIGNNTILNVEK